jgi:hypothetical protein
MEVLTVAKVRERVRSCRPDVTVITTAPSKLFWRLEPPDLRRAALMLGALPASVPSLRRHANWREICHRWLQERNSPLGDNHLDTVLCSRNPTESGSDGTVVVL